jgi:hypothetical protein
VSKLAAIARTAARSIALVVLHLHGPAHVLDALGGAAGLPGTEEMVPAAATCPPFTSASAAASAAITPAWTGATSVFEPWKLEPALFGWANRKSSVAKTLPRMRRPNREKASCLSFSQLLPSAA